MILKRSSFMLLGSMAFSAALLLSACGDSSSSSGTTEDDELGVTQIKAKSSSSSKKKNSSSSSDTSVKDAEDPSDLEESKSLDAPSKVTVVRLAPSVWELNFSYTGSGAKSLVVQRYAPGNKSWEEYDEIDVDLTHLLLDGSENGDHYYRLAAKNDETRSAYTEEVFVSDEVAYAEGISLAAPTAKPSVSEEKVLEIVLTGNYPGKKITKSTYNKNAKGKSVGGVVYEARFVMGAEKSVDTVKVSVDKSSISKEFKSVDEQCNAYAQIRVVWTDKNGVSDYGDWSDPMGTKAGTNSNLSDKEKICDKKASSDDGEDSEPSDSSEIALAVPTNLAVKNQDAGTWMLEWSYKPTEDRPEKGFVIQRLDLEKSKWRNFDSTGAGVYRALITGLTDPYNYFRVAAYDANGKSEFSTDILVTVSEEEAEATVVAPPSGLAIARVAPSVWELSWEYDIATDNPSRKFIIQSSKLEDFEWADVETELAGNVRYYFVQGRDKIETYYRMAVIDNGDTSSFTQAVQLTPNIPYRDYMTLAVPELSSGITRYYIDYLEVDRDTSTKNDVTYTDIIVKYTIDNNLASKHIYESEYTDDVYYEARWFKSVEYYNKLKGGSYCEGIDAETECDSCYWVEKIPYASPSIAKGFYHYDTHPSSITDENPEGESVYEYCERVSGYDPADHYKLFLPDSQTAAKIAIDLTLAAIEAAKALAEANGLGGEGDEGGEGGEGGTTVPPIEPVPIPEYISDVDRSLIMEREVSMSRCLLNHVRGMCGYLVQFRTVWTDRNGETDWSEWTSPYKFGAIDGASAICSD